MIGRTEFREFSLAGYAQLLGEMRNRKYVSGFFADNASEERIIYLRHDIDYWPELALDLAEAECRAGMRATYFFLVRSALYNPASDYHGDIVRQLSEMGHEIGLHIDTNFYKSDFESLENGVLEERRFFESTVGARVSAISFHRPAKHLLGTYSTIGGIPNTYSPYFFSEADYCSDSKGEWGHGHPLNRDSVKSGRPIQLLTHPVWWWGAACEPAERLRRLLKHIAEVNYRQLSQETNIKLLA